MNSNKRPGSGIAKRVHKRILKNSGVSLAFLAFFLVAPLTNKSLNGQATDEGDSFLRPNTVRQLPFNRVTDIQNSSDHDFFQFTAPANMKIRVRASGDWWHDPSCKVFSPSGDVWHQDDDDGPGRDALIEFDAVGGEQYVVSVSNRRSGPCRVRIDSKQLVASINDAPPEFRHGLTRGLGLADWYRGNQFGSEYRRWDFSRWAYGYVKRRLEIRSYCLDEVILDQVDWNSRLNDSFFETKHFSLPTVIDRPLIIDIEFRPDWAVEDEEGLIFYHRVKGKAELARMRVKGFGLSNTNASSFLGMRNHGFSTAATGAFANTDDTAHYHEFIAPVGGGRYFQAVVFALPESSDRYELVGTVFTNDLGSGEIARKWGKGFGVITTPVREGRSIVVKTEVNPDHLVWNSRTRIRFPNRYNVYVYFIPL